MKLVELCDLHRFIIEAGKRLKDEDGNLPFDPVTLRRDRISCEASMVVLDRILDGRYDHS